MVFSYAPRVFFDSSTASGTGAEQVYTLGYQPRLVIIQVATDGGVVRTTIIDRTRAHQINSTPGFADVSATQHIVATGFHCLVAAGISYSYLAIGD